MSPFFTRSGDDGYSGLLGEGRLPKYDLRMETLGSLDEANAALGLARVSLSSPEHANLVLSVQRDLYRIMAEIAASPENAGRFHSLDQQDINRIEKQIEAIEQEVEVPERFIVPGDTLPAARLDLARTIVRRAERRVAELIHRGDIRNELLIPYLNRLSSLCFILELYEIQSGGKPGPTLAGEGG